MRVKLIFSLCHSYNSGLRCDLHKPQKAQLIFSLVLKRRQTHYFRSLVVFPAIRESFPRTIQRGNTPNNTDCVVPAAATCKY